MNDTDVNFELGAVTPDEILEIAKLIQGKNSHDIDGVNSKLLKKVIHEVFHEVYMKFVSCYCVYAHFSSFLLWFLWEERDLEIRLVFHALAKAIFLDVIKANS